MPAPLSQKLSVIPPSPTLALSAKAQELAKQGKKITNCSIGEPDLCTPSYIVDAAIKSLQAGATRYRPPGGSLAIRQAASEKLRRENQVAFAPEQIVFGIGAKEILFHVFVSLLNPGDEVLLTAPCWVSYGDQIRAAGGVPVIVPFSGKSARFMLDTKLIESYASPRTVAFVLNSPNNPSGYVLTPQESEELGSYLKQKPWWVISDEIYEYFSFDRPHVSLLATTPELSDRFILVNGLSKGFCMTGWRVGYAAAPSAVAKLLKSIQSHTSTCLPAFIEDAATVALQGGKASVEANLVLFKAKRELVQQLLSNLKPSLSYAPLEGAFYAWLDLRHSPKPTLELSEILLNQYGLALIPGEAFACPGFLRLSYALPESELKNGIHSLEQWIQGQIWMEQQKPT